jgi:serine/threonine protein kinase
VLAEQWQRLRAAYDALMDAPESERARMLAEISGSDPDLGRELSALVAADADPDGALDQPLARLISPGLEPGTVLCDRFLLLRRIGRGGMGEVWAARDEKLKEDIAIKTIRSAGNDPQSLKRFTREIQLARRIAHQNVCRVYELFEDTSTTPARSFLTMELLEGETLAARLTRLGPMPPAEALEVFRQVVAGVGAAHDAEVIHRDLKPANIMLVAGSSGRRAVVMDFGLARDPVLADSDGMTAPGTLIGTPEYMAPEQVSGTPVTPATDIYALGLILFEMLRGAPPFAGTSTLDSWMRRAREGPARLSGEVPGVQARIDTVIARALEYQPSRRYQSAAQLLRALDASFHIVVPRTRRFWIPAAAVVFAAVVLGGAAAWKRLAPNLPSPEALKWYEDAHEALSESASVRALNAINRAIELAPDFAPSHAALAEIRLELDMPSSAQEAMLRANQLARDRSRLPEEYVRYMDGIQALLQRQCETAIDALRRVADMVAAPQRPVRMVTAARAMERCDRPDEAQNLMAAAARIDPRNAAVPLRSARLAARRRDYKAAYASLETAEALFRDRNNPEGTGEVLTLRGTFQAEQEQLDQAAATLVRAADVARSLDDARQQIRVAIQQAIVRRKRGDMEAANGSTEWAINLARSKGLETLTLEGLFASGNVHMVANQFREAQALFERALAIAETHRHDEYQARARLSLASAFVQTMRPRQAAEAIQSARAFYESIKQTRNLGIADALTGQVLMMSAGYGAAMALFSRQALAAAGAGDAEQETTARQNLASAMAEAGHYTDALAQFEWVLNARRVAGRVRGEQLALFNVSDTLSRMGRFAEAASAMASARRKGPMSGEIESQGLRIEATGALRQWHFGDAFAKANRALKTESGLSERRAVRAMLVLCLSAARLGRHAEARRTCDEASERTPSSEHASMWLESRLMVAEALTVLGAVARAAPLIEEAVILLEKMPEHDARWRALAVAAIANKAGPSAAIWRERLTREDDALRLKWSKQAYGTWRRRPDVAALLTAGGVAHPKE